jgi:hypothetical protein
VALRVLMKKKYTVINYSLASAASKHCRIDQPQRQASIHIEDRTSIQHD